MTAIDEAAREIPPDIAAEILRLKSEAAAMPVPPYDPLKQAHACLCAIRHVAKDIEQARKFADTGIAEAQQAVDARRHLAPPGERELEFLGTILQEINDCDGCRVLGLVPNGKDCWEVVDVIEPELYDVAGVGIVASGSTPMEAVVKARESLIPSQSAASGGE
jgi:hypothetical protein